MKTHAKPVQKIFKMGKGCHRGSAWEIEAPGAHFLKLPITFRAQKLF